MENNEKKFKEIMNVELKGPDNFNVKVVFYSDSTEVILDDLNDILYLLKGITASLEKSIGRQFHLN